MIDVAVYDTKPYDREYLGTAGGDTIRFRFHDFRLSAATASSATGTQAVCVFVNDTLDRPCLEALRGAGLRLVALRCAGFNNVDLPAAQELGIVVTRVPAYSPHAVAEHTVGLLLTLNRKIHRAYNRVREHNFSLNGLIGFDINGRTVGVVGTGKIGRLVARIFVGFGATIVAYDPQPDHAWAAGAGVNYAPLNDVLAASDILSLHTPLTPETHHLLNHESLARLKPGAYVVNTSRGKLIDTTALLHHLKSGHLGGVALDVYEEEEGIFFEDHSGSPLRDDELNLLLSFPNVLVTAHQAFFTREALGEISRVTTANIRGLDTGAFLPDTRLA
jgi:D-lactate dehydrogenase